MDRYPRSDSIVQGRSGLQTYMAQVYGWMTVGLLLTAFIAWFAANTPAVMMFVFSSKITFFGLIIAQLALNAQGVRPEWIASLSERGVGPLDLVELLGVVARTMAIDTFCFALGVDAWPLPDPPSGAHVEAGPHGEVDASAACNGGWLPTVGPAWPTNALSAVPSENRAMHQLQAAFYLATGEMGELDVQRGLHRTQMELVAARTSLLNECFF